MDLGRRLALYEQEFGVFPNFSVEKRQTLILQIISSQRRISYIRAIENIPFNAHRWNPRDNMFDPLRAAIHYRNVGNLDEAAWIVFLATHFGKHAIDGWRLMRDVYGGFGEVNTWTWNDFSADPQEFYQWISQNGNRLFNDGIKRRFSNHRKYESKRPQALYGALLAYHDWINMHGSFRDMINETHQRVGQHPGAVFDDLFQKASQNLLRFGRLGTFDLITMLGKLNLAPAVPPIPYLKTSTGPKAGARLLFLGSRDLARQDQNLDLMAIQLNNHLQVGMQVIEDALCNWQKSPESYVYFRG